MFRLIKKDFLAGYLFLLGSAASVTVISVTAVLALYENSAQLYVGFFAFTGVVLGLATSFVFFGIDSMLNSDILFLSLPVKRSEIVCARYLSAFLIAAGILYYSLTIGYFFTHLFIEEVTEFGFLLTVRGMIGLLSFILLAISYILPFLFRFGFGRGMSVAFSALAFLIISLPAFDSILHLLAGVFTFDLNYFNRIFSTIIKWIMGLHSVEMYGLSAAVAGFVVCGSLLLSVSFFKMRDL